MSEAFDENGAEAIVSEIQKRRYAPDAQAVDKRGWTSRQHLQNTADRTTIEDWHEVSDIILSLPRVQREAVELYRDISDEFARGLRCSVCGRTPAQNAALGYDCVREC